VDGTFQLTSACAENTRALYELSSGDEAVRCVHVVWLDGMPDD
jgi:hypothetical protein